MEGVYKLYKKKQKLGQNINEENTDLKKIMTIKIYQTVKNMLLNQKRISDKSIKIIDDSNAYATESV